MTPGSFDPKTAREVIGHACALVLEAGARTDADVGVYCPPPLGGNTYWSQVEAEMRVVVYSEQHAKRLARNKRKNAAGAVT